MDSKEENNAANQNSLPQESAVKTKQTVVVRKHVPKIIKTEDSEETLKIHDNIKSAVLEKSSTTSTLIRTPIIQKVKCEPQKVDISITNGKKHVPIIEKVKFEEEHVNATECNASTAAEVIPSEEVSLPITNIEPNESQAQTPNLDLLANECLNDLDEMLQTIKSDINDEMPVSSQSQLSTTSPPTIDKSLNEKAKIKFLKNEDEEGQLNTEFDDEFFAGLLQQEKEINTENKNKETDVDELNAKKELIQKELQLLNKMDNINSKSKKHKKKDKKKSKKRERRKSSSSDNYYEAHNNIIRTLEEPTPKRNCTESLFKRRKELDRDKCHKLSVPKTNSQYSTANAIRPSSALIDAELECLTVQIPNAQIATVHGFRPIKLEKQQKYDQITQTPQALRIQAIRNCTEMLKGFKAVKQNEYDTSNGLIISRTMDRVKLTEKDLVHQSPLTNLYNMKYPFNTSISNINYKKIGLEVLQPATARIVKILGYNMRKLKESIKQNQTLMGGKKIDLNECVESDTYSFYTDTGTQTNAVERCAQSIGVQVKPSAFDVASQTDNISTDTSNNNLPLMKYMTILNESQILALNDFVELLLERRHGIASANENYQTRQRLFDIYNSAQPSLQPIQTQILPNTVKRNFRDPRTHFTNPTINTYTTHSVEQQPIVQNNTYVQSAMATGTIQYQQNPAQYVNQLSGARPKSRSNVENYYGRGGMHR